MANIWEAAIAVCLVVVVASLTVIVIVSGAGSIAATGLRDLALLLGGALAGVTIPKGGSGGTA